MATLLTGKMQTSQVFLAACNEWYELYYEHRDETHLPVAETLHVVVSRFSLVSLGRLHCSHGKCHWERKASRRLCTIASRSLEAIPDRLKPHWDRKVTKRAVMTIPHNAVLSIALHQGRIKERVLC